MAEYIRRDDAVCAIREFSKTAVGIATEALVWAENVILDIVPSADVAEVVRCKDCRFHTTDPECFDEFEITDKPMMCVGIRYGGVDPDWFCEHGERMDGKQ